MTPRGPKEQSVMKAVSRLFLEFIESEKAGGLTLIACALISLIIANSPAGNDYVDFWHRYLDLSFPGFNLRLSLVHWINDGLMTLFFLLVGLEIERELYRGELSGLRNALLPIIAALGGMVVPALIHFSFNRGVHSQSGFGIPMATDIAFALGILSLVRGTVPVSLKVLLTALAIIDDLGAILVIAIFYSQGFSALHFIFAMTLFTALVVMNRLNVNSLVWYVVGGIAMWLFMLGSGIHPSIAGVLLAFAIPFRKGDGTSPSSRMEHLLDKPVPFLILPIFALANAAIIFEPRWYSSFIDSNTAGILAGLVIGKPVGIFLFVFLAVKTGLCRLSGDLSWRQVLGMGILAGTGFTMSVFIANLAFFDGSQVQNSKIAVLSASAIAGAVGLLFLSMTGKRNRRIA
jgi:Na+:H+ antiporter, NhaA family